MDREDIENTMKKIVSDAQSFEEAPTYEKAMKLDMDISILRFIIGEQNFLTLHYFRRVHEEAIKLIDKHDKESSKGK